MTRNVGGIERPIRIGLGVVLLLVGVFADLPTWGTAVVSLVGVVALVTGVIGFCPASKLLGINTCSPSSSAK